MHFLTQAEETNTYRYISGSRFNTNVCLFLTDLQVSNGLATKNRQVAIQIIYCLGTDDSEFPANTKKQTIIVIY